MIEQGIYFALGCIVTALASLMFAPIFWRRALRLTRQRLQLQVPLSMQEIYAERDQLRAEFAVERLRVEQALERVQAGKAHDMAEIGRRSMDVTRLSEELSAARQVQHAHETEIERLTRDLSERESRITGLTTDLQGAQDALGRARKDSKAALHEASLSRAMSVELQAAQAKLTADIEGLKFELQTAQHLGERLRGEAATRSREAGATHAGLTEKLGAAQTRADKLETDLATAVAALAEVRDREKSFHLENSLKAERGRADDRAATARLDALQSENEALRDSLDVARRKVPTPSAPVDDGGLRESIHALGLAVASMTREQQRASAPSEPSRRAEARAV